MTCADIDSFITLKDGTRCIKYYSKGQNARYESLVNGLLYNRYVNGIGRLFLQHSSNVVFGFRILKIKRIELNLSW